MSQETIDDLYFQIAALKTMISNMIRPATVKKVMDGNKIVADAGGFDTHEIPDGQHAGGRRHHSPMRVGQQITLLCPDGDINNAVVMPGGYDDKVKRPSTRADEDAIASDKGAIRVRDSGTFIAEVPSIQQFKIKIGGQVFCLKPEALAPTSDD